MEAIDRPETERAFVTLRIWGSLIKPAHATIPIPVIREITARRQNVSERRIDGTFHRESGEGHDSIGNAQSRARQATDSRGCMSSIVVEMLRNVCSSVRMSGVMIVCACVWWLVGLLGWQWLTGWRERESICEALRDRHPIITGLLATQANGCYEKVHLRLWGYQQSILS